MREEFVLFGILVKRMQYLFNLGLNIIDMIQLFLIYLGILYFRFLLFLRFFFQFFYFFVLKFKEKNKLESSNEINESRIDEYYGQSFNVFVEINFSQKFFELVGLEQLSV